MPSLLPRKPTCFYCGKRSSEGQAAGIRAWRCTNCEAINYLDEHGQITDPPASATPTRTHFAEDIRGRHSLSPESRDEVLFCETCVKNQHLLTQSLAAYLPPLNDPSYTKYEESYPEYRRNLEIRYPQVCRTCAPRVEQRIRDANYVAKTDHLRRLMERTKQGRHGRDRKGWRSIVIALGGVVWSMSIACELFWHAAGSIMDITTQSEGHAASVRPGVQDCVAYTLRTRRVTKDCYTGLQDALQWPILIGGSAFWWNNRLRGKYCDATSGRLAGVADHISLQVISLAMRLGAAFWLADPTSTALTIDQFRAFHGFMLIFLAITTLLSLFIVRFESTVVVDFNQEVAPLITDEEPEEMGTPKQKPQTFGRASPGPVHRFPIESLSNALSNLDSSRNEAGWAVPLTPSLADTESMMSDETESIFSLESENAMEWTPTKAGSPANNLKGLRPRRSQRNNAVSQQQISTEPSPFHGAIPPRPLAPAHKLRNPPNPYAFRKAGPERQQTFFSQVMQQTQQTEDNASPDAFSGPSLGRGELAPAQWRPRHDASTDTGLEAMFDSVFSIRDEPKEVQTAANAAATHSSSVNGSSLRRIRLAMFVSLILLSLSWGWKLWDDRRGRSSPLVVDIQDDDIL